MLQRYVDAGAKGLGEHKCAGPIDDPRRIELFAAAAELGLPILFHMDHIRNTDRPGLPGLEEVLKAVPNTVFFGHAPGWWNAIKDGTIDRLMDKYPNIHGDLSANSGYKAISRDVEFGRKFVLRRADRLCFATDYLEVGQKIPQFAFYDKLDLPEDVQTKIFRDNARRILKLT
ncbi:MAG: amidohydrolase family protein, partial [Pirellulales bacterium]|nr:amidohydrolase family protein [Pirellulales bacterium]